MFIYECDYIENVKVNWSLENYIINCIVAQGHTLLCARELHSTLVMYFTKLKLLQSNWKAELYVDDCFISSIVRPNKKPDIILTICQSQPKYSFIISSAEIGRIYTDLKLLKNYKTFSQDDMFKRMQEAYMFTDDIFSEAYKRLDNSKDKIISIDGGKKLVDQADSFDIDDFEQIKRG